MLLSKNSVFHTSTAGISPQDQAAPPKQELMPSVLQVSASLKLKDIFKLQHKLLSTTSTLLLTEVWRHYRLISALADCISIHWRARLNKYRSQNIIVGWALGFPSCPSLTWAGQVHCSTALWSQGWPGGAAAKQNNPIPSAFITEEQSKSKFFLFVLFFLWLECLIREQLAPENQTVKGRMCATL